MQTGLALGLTLAANIAHANNFTIDVSDDDIAVVATNASLKELLQELEKLTGIPVKFVADTNEKVTLNVGMTNIENAISKITPNHMIVHGSEDGKEVIKELIIIPAESDLSSGSSGSAFLPSGNPAPAVAQPQTPNQVTQTGDGTMQPQTPTTAPDPNQPAGEPAVPQPLPAPDGQVN